MYMLVRNLQKNGDYQKSILSQDENLRLAIQNDQNIADAVKKAKAGIRPDLTAKQNRIPEQVLTDVIEIKEKAMNNLRSIFTEEQAKKFLNGDRQTPPLTQEDLEYLNIFWEDLKPVLLSKTGLTLKFFRDIIKKSTAGRRANYGFYTGRTTPAKSLVINTTEELLKTVPPIDMLRAANKRASSIGQTLPEGATLSKDLSKLVRHFPTGGDKRLLKLEQLPPQDKMDFYKRFQDIFQGYDPDVEKWKKANMKDDMDFVNDIRNLIPDVTNFERDILQLYADLMTAREAITLPVPTVAEAKDELQEPLPDMKGEIIKQEEKETLPTIPEPKFVNMVDPQFYKEEPLEGESTLETRTREVSRLSKDLEEMLAGISKKEEVEERLKQESKAQLEEVLVATDEIFRDKASTLIQKMVRGRKAKADKEERLEKIQEARTFLRDKMFEVRQSRAITRDDQQTRRDKTQSQLSMMGRKRNQPLPPLQLLESDAEQLFSPVLPEFRPDYAMDIFNTTAVDIAKGRYMMNQIETRRQDSIDRALQQNREIRANREEKLKELAKSIVSLQKKRKGTETQDAEVQRLQLQQQFDREQEEELLLQQKSLLTQTADREAGRLDKLFEDLNERLSEFDDRLRNAGLNVKVGKARKREEKELRQLEEERAKVEQELVEVDNRREALQQFISMEEAPIELPSKLSRSVAFNPRIGTLEEEQIRLRQRLDELGDPTIRFLISNKSERAKKMEDDIYEKVKQDYDKVTRELDDIQDKAYRLETEIKIQDNKAAADQQLLDIMAMPVELIEDKRKKAQAYQSWLFSDLVRKRPALPEFRGSRFALRPEQQYPPLYAPSELQDIKNEQGELERDVRNKDKANEFAIGSLNYLRGKAFNKQNIDNLDKAWVELGKSKTDLALVEFKETLRDRFNPNQWADEIEDFIQQEKDEQARETLGMPRLYTKEELADDIRNSKDLTDFVQRNAIANLGSLTEDQFTTFIQIMGTNSLEEKARQLAERTAPPPKKRPTPLKGRERTPSMEPIVEEPSRPRPVRPTPMKNPTPSKSRPSPRPEPELVEPTNVNPLIAEFEQLTEQELLDQQAKVKRTKPRKDVDKLVKRNTLDAIQDVFDRRAFKEITPIDLLEQRFKSEGTAPKSPTITPRPARTPEQRRQAAEEKAAELEAELASRVPPSPRLRAPSPRLQGTPTKARVPVKTTFEKMVEQPVEELVKRAEAILPEVEKLARKRPTPNKARPAEEREGDREMADAQRRKQQSMEDMLRRDAELQAQELEWRNALSIMASRTRMTDMVREDEIRAQAQKEAELFVAENLRRSGVSRDDVVAVKTLIEQKKKDEGFTRPTITAKKALLTPYKSSENVSRFQQVREELPEKKTTSPRIAELLRVRDRSVSDAQERLRLQDEERKARLARELGGRELRPSEEGKMLVELNRANTPLSRPQTPTQPINKVQELVKKREAIKDWRAMKSEIDAGVPDKDAQYLDERRTYDNYTRTKLLWDKLKDDADFLGITKDEFFGKYTEGMKKKGLGLKPKTFIEFGKFKLNENMLEEGTLQVKTANGSPVPAFSKKIAISDTLQSILMDLIETKKLRGVSDLDDDERRLIETLIIKAGLAHGLGVKKVHQSDEDGKKVKRFDLVKGIYDAGNNSIEVIHELRSLILYFIKTKRLDRKAGIEALQELQ